MTTGYAADNLNRGPITTTPPRPKKRIRTRLHRLLTICGLLVTIVTGYSISSVPPAAAAANVTFFHMNIGGNLQHGGRTRDIGPAVVSSITSNWPDVVSLQEVCEQQFAYILWEINRLGGGYEARFATSLSRGADWCGGEGAYGDLLMTRGTNNTWDERILPNVGTEHRKLICVNTGLPVRIMACSAHLPPNDNKYVQMGWISDNFLIPFAQYGVPTVFLGDTYLDAAEMMYSTGGLFAHAAIGKTYPNCECPSPPAGCPRDPTHQYDYVMVSTNRFGGWSGLVTTTRWSDHRPVRAMAIAY